MTDPDPLAEEEPLDTTPEVELKVPLGVDVSDAEFDEGLYRSALEAEVEFPEDPYDDYRIPLDGLSLDSPNPNILHEAELWLFSGNAPSYITSHLHVLLLVLGAKIADYRNLVNPTHWHSPGRPFRYLTHPTLLGASGHGKGVTVGSFWHILGGVGTSQPLVPLYEWSGGSIEGVRGAGPNLELQPRREVPPAVRRGAIERTHMGFMHVPEFTQLVAVDSRGAIQTVLAWADTSRLSFETLSGGFVSATSLSTLVTGLQSGKLSEMEAAILGWNRRTLYDFFFPPEVATMLPATKPSEEPREGDAQLLATLRASIARALREWRPTSVDWRPFRLWIGALYRTLQLSMQDEQMLYALAIGEHIMSGREWTGPVVIYPSPWMRSVLQRLLWHKLEGRIDPSRRLSVHTLYVLLDPAVLGKENSQLPGRKIERVVAARLSVPENNVRAVLGGLVLEGYLRATPGTAPDYALAMPAAEVRKRLAGRE